MVHDPWGAVRAEAVAQLSEAIHAIWGEALDVEELVEEPPADRGDLALPCFQLARTLKEAPPAIAEKLADHLQDSDPVVDWTATGPFLNGRVVSAHLASMTLGAIQDRGTGYGRLPATGRRLLVEHTSANPTGPLHVGRARNPILGDSLARLLRAAGHEVVTEYYVNDMGKQVATMVWGVRNGHEADRHEKGDHRLVTVYQAANQRVKAGEGAEDISALIQAFEAGDEATKQAFRDVVDEVLGGVRETLARIGVVHDRFQYESELVLGGDVDEVVERLGPELQEESDGARYLDLKDHPRSMGKDELYLLRSDGTTLYATRDLAYHLNKLSRSDALVNVLGEDHKLAMSHLVAALEHLDVDPDDITVVFYNFVSLPEGRMSTRAGRVVYMDDLMDEAEARAYEEVKARRGDDLTEEQMREVARVVGVGALRFNILGVQAEKPITFRWEEALSFDGATAPFVQYSHARACSVLDRAAKEADLRPGDGDPEDLEHETALSLVRSLARYPGLVRSCAEARHVHPLIGYAVSVADAFNAFYRDCHVMGAPTPELRAARLDLVDATRQVLASVCDVLGITAPAEM